MPQPPSEPRDCSLSEPYALQVLGNEMEPEFPDRCIILVEPTDRCDDGAYVVALVEDSRWFRQFRQDAEGNEWLAAVNPLYPDIPLDGLSYRIEGVIVQRNIRRRVKRYGENPRGLVR